VAYVRLVTCERSPGSHERSSGSHIDETDMSGLAEVDNRDIYHLNKMLIANKHIADNNFVFQ